MMGAPSVSPGASVTKPIADTNVVSVASECPPFVRASATCLVVRTHSIWMRLAWVQSWMAWYLHMRCLTFPCPIPALARRSAPTLSSYSFGSLVGRARPPLVLTAGIRIYTLRRHVSRLTSHGCSNCWSCCCSCVVSSAVSFSFC